MRTQSKASLAAALSYAVVLLSLLVGTAHAGTMSFSVYSDGAINSSLTLVYNYSNVFDNSSGCTHSNYSTTATIVSPSNRTATLQSSGLHSTTSLSINGEYGTYNFTTSGTFFCGCSQMTSGYGGGHTGLIDHYKSH